MTSSVSLPAGGVASAHTDKDHTGRVHAFLVAFLPAPLLASMPASTGRRAFLQSLSSGQLLCVAYNACVRRSRKPWGYITKDSIHDILGLQQAADRDGQDEQEKEKDEKGKRMWTFRRTDNLRLWAGCVRL
jgi:hypothetical protein